MPRSCATACYCVLPSYSDPVEIVWSKNLNFTLIVHISFIFKDCLIIRSSNLMLRATEYGSGTSVKEAGSVTIYTIYTLYTIYMVQVRSRRKSSEAADGGEAAVRSSLDERVLQGAIGTGQGAILNKARRCPLQSRLRNRWLPERWWFSYLKSTIVFSITKLPWWRRHRSQKRNLIFRTRSLGGPCLGGDFLLEALQASWLCPSALRLCDLWPHSSDKEALTRQMGEHLMRILTHQMCACALDRVNMSAT